MQTPRLIRRVATAAVVASVLAGSATAEAAPTVHANCYSDGTVSTTLWFDKIGLGGQWLGYNLQYYDIDRGRVTAMSGWRTWYSSTGVLATPAQDYRHVQQARYLVYAEIGWNLGAGWSVHGVWAGSYLTGGDFFGVPERFCRATPQLQVVSGNCDSFGGVVACASGRAAPAANRVRRPTSRAGVQRLQGSKNVRRLVRRNLPAPPTGTLPPAQR